MVLNGRQRIKLVVGVICTLVVLFGSPGATTPYKAVLIAIVWLAVVAAVWLRRGPV